MLATSVLVRQQLQIDRWLVELLTRAPSADLFGQLAEELSLHLDMVDAFVAFLERRNERVPRTGASEPIRRALRELIEDDSDGLRPHRLTDLRWLFRVQCHHERENLLPLLRRLYSIDELEAIGKTMDHAHTQPEARRITEAVPGGLPRLALS